MIKEKKTKQNKKIKKKKIAARAPLFSAVTGVISLGWDSNQSAVLLVFLAENEHGSAAFLRCSRLLHALVSGGPGNDSSSALANSSTYPVHGLCWCQCESFLPLCAIEFFFSKFYYAAHQVTISTLITACDLDAGRAGASGENQVKLVPLLRSWVSSGDCVRAWY